MNEPVDELYFQWLYSQISDVRLKSPHRQHWDLARQLHRKEFVWIVPNDDNRVEDGRDLRQVFLHDSGVFPDQDWLDLGCSFLEMLIALAHHLSFMDGRPVDKWFWRMLDNLELEVYTDRNYGDECVEVIDAVLDRVIWRTYEPDGLGGLFPLEHPQRDQREVEIWYQLNAYLLDSA